MNYGVDTHFYPLGSCTMKYNPKINEDMARLRRLRAPAPAGAGGGAARARSSSCTSSGRDLAEISGMDEVSLQPAAGAQGELAGVLMIRAYHLARGERAPQGADPRLGPRHQPGLHRAGRLLGGRAQVGGERRRGPGRPRAAPRRGRGRVHDHPAEHARPVRVDASTRSPRCATPRACRSTWTAPTSTPSSASPGRATWASTCATSTCTRPSPPRTAAAGRARGRSASRRTWPRSCRPRWW